MVKDGERETIIDAAFVTPPTSPYPKGRKRNIELNVRRYRFNRLIKNEGSFPSLKVREGRPAPRSRSGVGVGYDGGSHLNKRLK